MKEFWGFLFPRFFSLYSLVPRRTITPFQYNYCYVLLLLHFHAFRVGIVLFPTLSLCPLLLLLPLLMCAPTCVKAVRPHRGPKRSLKKFKAEKYCRKILIFSKLAESGKRSHAIKHGCYPCNCFLFLFVPSRGNVSGRPHAALVAGESKLNITSSLLGRTMEIDLRTHSTHPSMI